MADSKPDPYEVLGVAKDATQEEIRKAWQRAAKAAHPDRAGGSNERMALVNTAYAILRDPAARKQWDENKSTGGVMSDEDKAMTLLRGAAYAAISQIMNGANPIEAIRTALDGQVGGCQHARVACHRELEALERMRKRVKGPSPNFLADMIDKEIEQRRERLPDFDNDEKLFELALTMLGQYSLEPELQTLGLTFGGGVATFRW